MSDRLDHRRRQRASSWPRTTPGRSWARPSRTGGDGAHRARPEAFDAGRLPRPRRALDGPQDGARLPFRPPTASSPIGVITEPRGRARGRPLPGRIFDGPEGDDYLPRSAAGLNGVSIEASLPDRIRKDEGRHRRPPNGASCTASRGPISPAFDGARVARISDMEETSVDERDPAGPRRRPEPTERPARAATSDDPVVAGRSAAQPERRAGLSRRAYSARSGSFLPDAT